MATGIVNESNATPRIAGGYTARSAWPARPDNGSTVKSVLTCIREPLA